MKKKSSCMSLLLVAALGSVCLNVCQTRAEDAARRPHVVLISFEDEYHSAETLPRFARDLTDRFGFRCSMLTGDPKFGIRGLDALNDADVLVLYARRHALPKPQMTAIRRYLERGGAIVALRTSSHAFAIKTALPEGFEVWPDFDYEVLGGNYHDHFPAVGRMKITLADNASQHPILAGVDLQNWTSSSSLYRTSPLASNTTVLLWGTHNKATEPLAWTSHYHGARVFYAAIGNVEDFRTPSFNTMLVNAIYWAMNKPVPKTP